MMIVKSIPTLFLAVAALPLGISGRKCYTNTTRGADGERTLLLDSPDQLSQFDGCTVLEGNIRVSPRFSGSIVLNGVTDFIGNLDSVKLEDFYYVIDAIEMRDLRSIGSVGTDCITIVEELRLPRVESMGSLCLVRFFGAGRFDLGALKKVKTLEMGGDWENISFPSLETVDFGLTIDTYIHWFGPDQPPVNIDLPALREVGSMNINGRIESLRTPNLTTFRDGNSSVDAMYTDLAEVSLPSLAHINTGALELSGRIRRIDLGGMQKTDASITIRASSPVEIHSALRKAGAIDFSGKLQSINLKHITHASNMTISSSLPAHCPPTLIHLYRKLNPGEDIKFCDAHSLQLAGHDTPRQTPTPTPTSTPTPTPAWGPTPTPMRAPLSGPGLSIQEPRSVVSLCCLVGIFAITGFSSWCYRNRDRGTKHVSDKVVAWARMDDEQNPIDFTDIPPPYAEDPLK